MCMFTHCYCSPTISFTHCNCSSTVIAAVFLASIAFTHMHINPHTCLPTFIVHPPYILPTVIVHPYSFHPHTCSPIQLSPTYLFTHIYVHPHTCSPTYMFTHHIFHPQYFSPTISFTHHIFHPPYLSTTIFFKYHKQINIQMRTVQQSNPQHPPPKTHTCDRPIFKISFDSENLGKFMRHSIAISLIFAS